MKSNPFYFEIKDVMTQFVAAFNDIIINRHDKYRDIRSRVKVRYVYAPKQRVVHDLTNKARHITLPVVAVNITGISRDESRVFNKIYGSYMSQQEKNYSVPRSNKAQHSYNIPQPVPVSINVNMSILCKYQTDIEQIISNFVPYCDPYIIISWKLPKQFFPEEQELRSEVQWNGDLNMNYPEDISATDPYRLSCDTSFTIKAWLFKKDPEPIENVYKITTNITPTNVENVNDLSYTLPYYDETEKSYIQGLGAPLTAAPFITHIDTIGDLSTVLGYNFNSTTNVYLSSTEINQLSGGEIIPFTSESNLSSLYPPFSGVEVNFRKINDYKIEIDLLDVNTPQQIDVIIQNAGGYDTALSSTLHGKGIFLLPLTATELE